MTQLWVIQYIRVKFDNIHFFMNEIYFTGEMNSIRSHAYIEL